MASGSNKPGSSSAAKSAKALQAAKSSSGGARKGSSPMTSRQVPWVSLGAGAVVLALVVGLAVFLVPQFQEQAEAQAFVPSAENPDPSLDIEGVTAEEFAGGNHVDPDQRVAYEGLPPMGGAHDAVWANCLGTVYPDGLRTENAVHSMEHGAVWITYNPDELSEDQVGALTAKVEGQPYTLMSAWPGLDTPMSLQSWGHQLALEDPADPRVDQFISALRVNSNTHPEVGASCDSNPASFDPDNPPPFNGSEPGPDAVPATGDTPAQEEDVTEPPTTTTEPAPATTPAG